MSRAIDHDQLFKQLLSTFFLEFLDLFAPELATNIESVELARFLEAEESGRRSLNVKNEDRSSRSGEGQGRMFAIDCYSQIRPSKSFNSIWVCR
jgi:hypothetical protein